ncbi:MAG: ROK family protein [Provencibacterium sp.]|jgi:glucokinase|nr:ROK family protein [Provencibacterium sp.]
MTYSIGVDIGGTSIKAGLVDEQHKIVRSMALPTLSCEGKDDGEKVAACVVKLMETLCAEEGIKPGDLRSAGAGIPGSIDSQNGIVIYTNNIDLHNVPLRDMVKEKVGLALQMANDADAAAYGEYRAGAAAGCDSCILITLGTGLGGGFIKNGEIYSGYNQRGGEFGHTVVQLGGAPCTCGRLGCLEAYASATGLIRLTREAMQRESGSLMWELAGGELNKVDGKTAFDAMEKGDAAGQAVVNTYIRYLACGIANFINVLHPDMVCLGGGISHSGDALLLPLRKEMAREIYGGMDEYTTRVELAALGNSAGIIGAALL